VADVNCAKCKKRMEEGFILDRGHGYMYVTSWVAGLPEKSFWVGLKIKGRTEIPISTFRCTGCGYLESYARPASS
jgi:hypothetical protein